jgi:hypothetical protein
MEKGRSEKSFTRLLLRRDEERPVNGNLISKNTAFFQGNYGLHPIARLIFFS